MNRFGRLMLGWMHLIRQGWCVQTTPLVSVTQHCNLLAAWLLPAACCLAAACCLPACCLLPAAVSVPSVECPTLCCRRAPFSAARLPEPSVGLGPSRPCHWLRSFRSRPQRAACLPATRLRDRSTGPDSRRLLHPGRCSDPSAHTGRHSRLFRGCGVSSGCRRSIGGSGPGWLDCLAARHSTGTHDCGPGPSRCEWRCRSRSQRDLPGSASRPHTDCGQYCAASKGQSAQHARPGHCSAEGAGATRGPSALPRLPRLVRQIQKPDESPGDVCCVASVTCVVASVTCVVLPLCDGLTVRWFGR